MDRQYKKADSVRVFKDQASKDTGVYETTITRVPYAHGGFENYVYNGVLYKGFVDPSYECEACIILTEPFFKNKRLTKSVAA